MRLRLRSPDGFHDLFYEVFYEHKGERTLALFTVTAEEGATTLHPQWAPWFSLWDLNKMYSAFDCFERVRLTAAGQNQNLFSVLTLHCVHRGPGAAGRLTFHLINHSSSLFVVLQSVGGV